MPTFQQFPLPDAGEGLTEAEIVAWHVAVGDTVEVNQTIVEIETAKSLVDLPSPWAGVVTRLMVEPGQTVDVGTPIIEVDTDPHGEAPADEAPPAAAPQSGGAIEHGHHGGHDRHAGVEPGGSDEIEAARPARAPEPAAEPAAREAVLVGYGLAEPAAGRRGRTPDGSPAATSSAPVATPSAPAATSSQREATRHALAKPPVRKLARELGVDLDSVSPTGPGGIVTREDVLARAAQAEARTLATYPGDDAPWLASGTVSSDGRQTRVPVKSVRKRTAEAMVTSAFTAPHVTVFHTVDVTKTMKLVERLRADREFADVRVTPLLIAAKALMLAVRRHPEINGSWDEAAQEIVYKHYINLGIAAATPRGLVVPNMKDAHRLNLKDLAGALADLTSTARAGKTSPSDMSDGTITITNVGVFGIDTGTPIINPGEAAILAFGAIREQPWVHKGKIRIRHVTQLALSFDHRLVDGALGSQVLADVARVLHDPSHGLVWG
ncbi:dihydrolipoamide acetyltransferase family protein [Cellulomonas xylanilytica]|uniref:Dihydrolipoamide acetyltransferase component of pyruvate dehydrogenase complex n=1 Tax=Cellulomonas xylanilytica TaxID=233583 RepID=A0A510V543_9CELL|nr:dihydrolipoamide acetyltransferase family protein [Cellulomonas xylanilytica]GEK21984.1 dihydrolipoamide acetyltransferase component of pyruvate dehydrogenase complex [Cellulomonas xylanilytica]